MSYTLGLDLGTTYTAAAVCRGAHCEISPLGNRSAVDKIVHLRQLHALLFDETLLEARRALRLAEYKPCPRSRIGKIASNAR